MLFSAKHDLPTPTRIRTLRTITPSPLFVYTHSMAPMLRRGELPCIAYVREIANVLFVLPR